MDTSLVISPLIPIGFIVFLAISFMLVSAFGQWRGLRSFIFRMIAGFLLCGALLNPQKLIEEKEALPDIALVLMDSSQSMELGSRAQDSAFIQQALSDTLSLSENLQTIILPIPAANNGTNLMQALIDGLSQYPSDRIAGVFAITDGQATDIPQNIDTILPKGVPFHALIVGDKKARDRRLVVLETPRYGLVGEDANFKIRIEDIGHEGERARLQIKVNGVVMVQFDAIIGDDIPVPLSIEKRGVNSIEIRAAKVDGEISTINNMFVSQISGVRDRLRVLLITGEPHMGGRAWRNLLKSDPSVDLVQFTILTNPGKKNPRARPKELSLIRFPDRELFEDKLEEFDLVIFDHFKRRTVTAGGRARPMLNPVYIANIAQYVENGGALLVATGPAFSGDQSLAKSPLISVLPARPTGDLNTGAFRPRLNEKGSRHPITSIFSDQAGNGSDRWGKWYRTIDAEIIGGDVIMTHDDLSPLLVIDKIEKGRSAVLLSDQAWLWSRGHDGGGPYNELFRRLSHWLMGEPDLEADRLLARIDKEQMSIDHFSMDDDPKNVTILRPDGSEETLALKRISTGHYGANISAYQEGAYSLKSGDLNTIAAAHALNPAEFKNVLPTADIVQPLVNANQGFAYWTGAPLASVRAAQSVLPTIVKARKPKASTASNAMLKANQQSALINSTRIPFGPTWLYFLLIFIALLGAWWRESR